jgi:hypothetical protein
MSGGLSPTSVLFTLPISSQDPLFSSSDSIFSSDDDEQGGHGNVLVHRTPSPALTSGPPPPYEPTTPAPSQARRASKVAQSGVSRVLSSTDKRNLEGSREVTPTPLPSSSDCDTETTPRANQFSSRPSPTPFSEDDEPFGSQIPGLLPVNSIAAQAWKGLDPAQVAAYLHAFTIPSPPSMIVDASGLAGGSASEQTVFVRTPHAGVSRAAGNQVQSSEQDRITVATGRHARAMTLMPDAGTAAVAYMKKGEVLIHTIYADDVDEEPAVSAASRARKGKARATTPPSPTPPSLQATTPPASSPPSSPPPVEKVSTSKASQRRSRCVLSSAMVVDDSPPASPPPVAAPSRRRRRSGTVIIAPSLTAQVSRARHRGAAAPLEAVHLAPVPVFDLAELLAEAPPPARRIARLPRHHTYQRAVTGPKAFHRDVERALVPASEKDMMDGGLTEAGLRSTPLAENTALIWPLVASWGSGLVSILQMCILAKSSDFPRGKNTYLPGNTGLRPKAIRWFIKCGRVLMPGVFGKYTLDYPQEFEDYWRSMIPPGAQPRRNLSKIDNNRWTRMRLAGPNGI